LRTRSWLRSRFSISSTLAPLLNITSTIERVSNQMEWLPQLIAKWVAMMAHKNGPA
jgi:hypothetical protein